MVWLDIDIINRALRLIKEKPISNINDNTPTARCVRDIYPQVKRLTLCLHPWNCATKSVHLTDFRNNEAGQLQYHHLLPQDCLKLVEVHPSMLWHREGNKLLSNNKTLDVVYVADVQSHEIDDNVIRVIAARLAFEAAESISQSSNIANAMYNLYEKELSSAKQIDANEAGQGKFEFVSTWI